MRLFFAGDVSFGRSVGQRVLTDPDFDPFARVSHWMRDADLRAVNLESVLSDQGGVTEHPLNPLVFSGPPDAASVLSRSGVDVVSVANNHSWDYGKKGLFESLGHLERAGIAASGASRSPRRQYEPVYVERRGIAFAFLAFTQVWNDGKLDEHPAAKYVADVDYEAMKRAVRRARERADFVVVSLHASNEYVPLPRERTRRFARGAIRAGADLVFGHHPHVVQGVEWVGAHPVFYSLGNLVFDSKRTTPDAREGAVALVELSPRTNVQKPAVSRVELCAVTLETGLPIPADAEQFSEHVKELSQKLGGIAPRVTERGCVEVPEREDPLPDHLRHGFAPDPAHPEDDG